MNIIKFYISTLCIVIMFLAFIINFILPQEIVEYELISLNTDNDGNYFVVQDLNNINRDYDVLTVDRETFVNYSKGDKIFALSHIHSLELKGYTHLFKTHVEASDKLELVNNPFMRLSKFGTKLNNNADDIAIGFFFMVIFLMILAELHSKIQGYS